MERGEGGKNSCRKKKKKRETILVEEGGKRRQKVTSSRRKSSPTPRQGKKGKNKEQKRKKMKLITFGKERGREGFNPCFHAFGKGLQEGEGKNDASMRQRKKGGGRWEATRGEKERSESLLGKKKERGESFSPSPRQKRRETRKTAKENVRTEGSQKKNRYRPTRRGKKKKKTTVREVSGPSSSSQEKTIVGANREKEGSSWPTKKRKKRRRLTAIKGKEDLE